MRSKAASALKFTIAMKLKIKKMATIEDKEIFSVDPQESVSDDERLRQHPRLKKMLFDRYHYFEKATDTDHPNRWILYLSSI